MKSGKENGFALFRWQCSQGQLESGQPQAERQLVPSRELRS